jgi:D-alanyl-D-alanine carboxypeptidase
MTVSPTVRFERLTAALADIDGFVALRLPRLDAPGVAVGLTDRERTLGFVCRGSADVASGTPIEPDTRFQIGSISKSFAAAVMLQEHDAGRVDLRAPVTDYVPWFAVRSRFGPITLHHLLSHTSGLIMGTEFTAEARGAVWALRETDTGSAPGERFWYSNDGYKLVGLALEAVTGRPVHELVAERIVAPLGMAATETTIRRDSRLPVATGYERRGDDRPAHGGRPLDVAPLVESCSADGSIVSSAADMLAYARLILNRGDAPGGRLLSEAAFGRWSAPEVEDPDEPGSFYGYGLVTRTIDGYACIGHSGGMVGFNSLLVTEIETGLGVIVLLNGSGDRMEIATYALAALRAALAGAPAPPPPPPVDPAAIGAAASDYAGEYVLAEAGGGGEGVVGQRPAGGERVAAGDDLRRERAAGDALRVDRLVFVARDGRLAVVAPSGAEVVLERRDDDLFLAPHLDWDRFHLRFERDDGGAVVALSFGPDWFARAGRSAPPAPVVDPSWTPLAGAYRSYNPWSPVFRVFCRRGRLWMVAPWLYPSDELELVPLADGRFRVGAAEWLPSRISFDTVIDGRAIRAVYDGAPFYRTFT